MKTHRHIFWDWNGTLVNDTRLCLEILNGQLRKSGLVQLTMGQYRDRFEFPLRKFYQDIGFDFRSDPFENISLRFGAEYEQRRFECSLHKGVRETIRRLSAAGMRHSVLSAYNQELLVGMIAHFGLSGMFDHIIGPDNTHADGKIGEGQRLLDILGIPASQVIMIGDTVHDFEVARAIGVDCVLVACGHHTQSKLEQCGVPVAKGISEAGMLVQRA
jgi:phosphoglycolate phosphatase